MSTTPDNPTTNLSGKPPVVDLATWQTARDELIVYQHMWYDGAPHQGQCEGCTTTAWHMNDAVYLNARGVSFAILTPGRWDEVAAYVNFMGYHQPWYSVRDVDPPIGGEMGHLMAHRSAARGEPMPTALRRGARPAVPSRSGPGPVRRP